MSRFLSELRRRNVIRVAGLYLAGAWLLAQVAGTVLPMFAAPAWIARTVIIVLAIGFVPALVFTWVFEWTPKGLVREDAVPEGESIAPQTGKRIDRWIMLVLAVALGFFAFDKFVLSPGRQAEQVQEAREQGRSDAVVARYGDRSIAVLPFADMSQARDQQYLSDGIAEELLNLLAKVPELRVISRSSAFAFRDKDVDIPTIAKQLKVGYVLDGAIRKAGDRIRVTVQLIDARSDTQLWNDTYDRPLDDIFAIQDQIGTSVVEQLKVKLLGKAAPTVAKTDPKAYTLYLQAMAIPLQEEESYEKVIGMHKQVLAIDPRYVPAWNALAIAYGNQAAFGLVPASDGYRLSRQAANQALAVDPDDSQAHAQLANIALRHDGDVVTAALHMQRALATGAHELNNLNLAEDIAKSLGRIDEAVAIDEYIVARDPMQAIGYSQLGIAYQQAGLLDKSIAASRTALDMEPGQQVTRFIIGSSLLLKGDAKAALAEMQQEPFEPFRLFGEAMTWHSLGDKAKSDATLADIIAKYDKDAAYNIAYVEAWRGNADQAFAWLNKAVEYRDTALPMVAIEPLFASLHEDPRWLPFLRRLGKAPEQLAKIEFKVDLPGQAQASISAP